MAGVPSLATSANPHGDESRAETPNFVVGALRQCRSCWEPKAASQGLGINEGETLRRTPREGGGKTDPTPEGGRDRP